MSGPKAWKVRAPGDGWEDALVIHTALASDDADEAATRAAGIFFYEHDGSEWMKDGLVFEVMAPDGAITRHELAIEAQPMFSFSEIL